MSWLAIAEEFLPSTRSKFIAAVSVALTTLVYVAFKELPSSWLPTSESEAFLFRLLITETIALIGVVATLISVVCDYRASPNLNQGIKEVRSRPRQKAIDDLAEELSWAIHHLLNKNVSNEAEVSQWESEYKAWCQRVSAKLENRAYFTKANQLHFDRLGFVPPANFAGSYNRHHEWLISQLNLKFERLRDIINK
jgi:hypothetical protein